MKRVIVLILLLLLAGALTAQAETVDERVDSLALDAVQDLADEAGAGINVREMIRQLATRGAGTDYNSILDWLKALAVTAAREAFPSLLTLAAPALLWAVNRQLSGGGKLAASAEFVCYVAEASLLTAMFAGQMSAARTSMERIAALIERFNPVMTVLVSASGATGMSGLMQPVSALAASIVTSVMRNAVFALSGAAAVLAVAGNMTDRLKMDGLFKLCKSSAHWIIGCSMTLFLGLLTLGGVLESGRDGLTIRTAEYAVDKLLPVIGKEMSKSLRTVAAGTAMVRGAAGVTGAVLLVSLCIGPALRMAACVICCRIAAAVTEPAAGGPICKCLRAFADAMQILLVAQAACAALFLIIMGAAVAAGGAVIPAG